MRGVKGFGCSVDGCGGKHFAHGLCEKHYAKTVRMSAEDAEQFVLDNKSEIWPRFIEKVSISDCWEWIASKNNNGYGQLNVGNRPVLAHRVSWLLHNGEIPKGMFLCHKCDNPNCVNPSHLFVGTAKENVQDMLLKGRNWQVTNQTSFKSGSGHPNAKVTEELVRKIRDFEGSYKDMTATFGLSQQALCDIRKRRTWAHVD